MVQQGGREAPAPAAQLEVGGDGSVLEGEANRAADAVMAGGSPRIAGQAERAQLYRHKDDIVAYRGGQKADVVVIKAGVVSFIGSAVSGHPGHREHEEDVGPTPAGLYVMHPGIQRPTVDRLQGGTCGANPISSGYQEITSTDPSPCTGAHYCNVACGTPANPARTCFTPRDCWGPKRIKIEGSADVPKPGGGTVHRDGFYLHGGNPADAVSSGCVKALNDDVFGKVRELTGVDGKVPFCVGSGCPPSVDAAVKAAAQAAAQAAEAAMRKVMESMVDILKGMAKARSLLPPL